MCRLPCGAGTPGDHYYHGTIPWTPPYEVRAHEQIAMIARWPDVVNHLRVLVFISFCGSTLSSPRTTCSGTLSGYSELNRYCATIVSGPIMVTCDQTAPEAVCSPRKTSLCQCCASAPLVQRVFDDIVVHNCYRTPFSRTLRHAPNATERCSKGPRTYTCCIDWPRRTTFSNCGS